MIKNDLCCTCMSRTTSYINLGGVNVGCANTRCKNNDSRIAVAMMEEIHDGGNDHLVLCQFCCRTPTAELLKIYSDIVHQNIS